MGLIISTEGAGFPPRGAAGSFKLPFQEQIDFFNQKLALPSNHYDDILKAAHDRAFIVAGAAKADLLADLHGAVKQAVNEGKTISWFRKEFDAIVKKHGWTGWTGEGSAAGVAWHTKVIYQTNLSTSYAAGRWAQLNAPDLLSVRPYWKYIHNDSVAHPRELHQSWNGVVLPHDHPWWATHFCPNGWGCRCRIMAVRAKEFKGKAAPNDGTYNFTSRDGTVHAIPKGIDYGFDYAPSESTAQTLTAFVNNKITNYPSTLAKAVQASVSKLFKKESTASATDLIPAKQTAINYVLENGKKFGAKNIEFTYIYDESGEMVFTKQGKDSG
ncbi:MAG: phage minor head protein [Methylococcales bacterium]